MVNKEEHKVNIKARIDRHSRWLQDNLTLKNKVLSLFKKSSIGYKIVLFCMIFIIPVYPMFAGIIYSTSQAEFYRWYIDEESILDSYYVEREEVMWANLLEWNNEFLADTSILNDYRNYDWLKEVREYIVEPWDSVSVISSKFKVTMATVYEYNNFTKYDTLKPWKLLEIPAVSWIRYKVKKADTILAIAKKYKIDQEVIIEFNEFSDNKELKIGEELFLPWAVKIIERPKYVPPKKTYRPVAKASTKKYTWSQYTNSKWVYPLVRRAPFSWARWNCTWYVASYKKVNWRWNANQWMRNAKAKWNKVVYGRWFAPKLWSIVVLEWRWYNLRYGHVAIVMEVKDWYMIVSDMNYRRLNEVTYRKINLNSGNITGYIYVD